MKCLFLIFVLAFAFDAKTQHTPAEEIFPNTAAPVLATFLKSHGTVDIEFNADEAEGCFKFRLQNKKGKWGLFDVCESFFWSSDKCDLLYPDSLMYAYGFTIALKKNKECLFSIENEKLTKCYQKLHITSPNPKSANGYFGIGDFEIVGQKRNKWARLQLSLDENEALALLPTTDFIYQHPTEVPQQNYSALGHETLIELVRIRKKHGLNPPISLDPYGYHFLGQSQKTGLWGYYVGEGILTEAIPPLYDSLHFYEKNSGTVVVWKNNKAGAYNSEYELTFPIEFDAFKEIFLDYQYGCGFNKNGFWQLYDCFNAQLLISGKSINPDELIDLWLQRHD